MPIHRKRFSPFDADVPFRPANRRVIALVAAQSTLERVEIEPLDETTFDHLLELDGVEWLLQPLVGARPQEVLLSRRKCGGELCETTTARWVVEHAEDLLGALDDHRAYVLARLKKLRGADQTAWPF